MKLTPPWPNFFFVLNGFIDGNSSKPATHPFIAPDKLADGWWFNYPADGPDDPPFGPYITKDEAIEAAKPRKFLGHWFRPVSDLEAAYAADDHTGVLKAETRDELIYWVPKEDLIFIDQESYSIKRTKVD